MEFYKGKPGHNRGTGVIDCRISLHLSLSKHSLFVYSSPFPLSTTFSCMYSFTLSYNWPSSPRTHNFTHIHLLQTLHYLPLKMTKPPQKFFFFHPFYYTIFHSMCTKSHTISAFIHTSIALTLPYYHTTCVNSFARHSLLTFYYTIDRTVTIYQGNGEHEWTISVNKYL